MQSVSISHVTLAWQTQTVPLTHINVHASHAGEQALFYWRLSVCVSCGGLTVRLKKTEVMLQTVNCQNYTTLSMKAGTGCVIGILDSLPTTSPTCNDKTCHIDGSVCTCLSVSQIRSWILWQKNCSNHITQSTQNHSKICSFVCCASTIPWTHRRFINQIIIIVIITVDYKIYWQWVKVCWMNISNTIFSVLSSVVLFFLPQYCGGTDWNKTIWLSVYSQDFFLLTKRVSKAAKFRVKIYYSNTAAISCLLLTLN